MTLIEMISVAEDLPISLGMLRILKIYRVLKLLRIMKFKNVLKRLKNDSIIRDINNFLISNTWINEVAILIVTVVFFIHFMACMYKNFTIADPNNTTN